MSNVTLGAIPNFQMPAVSPLEGPGQAAGYVWEGGKPFYGTRVGPGWYQGSTSKEPG